MTSQLASQLWSFSELFFVSSTLNLKKKSRKSTNNKFWV